MDKVIIRNLPLTQPPVLEGGGRITTAAGELAQIVSGGSFSFLAYIEFLYDPSKPRGNHYHAVKTETLYVIKGSLRAIYNDIETDASEEVKLGTGDLVTIKPKCAHVYYALEYTQTVELSDRPYDPADTLPFVIKV